MSDYGADDEDWFEDMWFVDDIENLPDILAPTAYAHSPPYAPDTYDFYDSDYDEYQTSGDDSYFDGSPAPSPPTSTTLSPATTTPTRIPHPIQPSKTQTHVHTPPISPTLNPTSRFVARLESRYKEAVQGKKFYGEREVGDEKYLLRGMRRRRRGVGVGEGGVRKRRKVEVVHLGTTNITGEAVPVQVGVVEIGFRSGEVGEVGSELRGRKVGEGEKDDDGSASAEGYNSDRDSLEDQQQHPQTTATATARAMKKVQVVIRPPLSSPAAAAVAKPPRSTSTMTSTTVGGGGGDGRGSSRGRGNVTTDNCNSSGGGRWACGTGRRRLSTKSPTAPLPQDGGPVTRKKAEVIIGGGRRGGAGGKRKTTPLGL